MNQASQTDHKSDNPYAVAAAFHESEPSQIVWSLAAIAIGLVAGVFVAALGYILCWVVIRIFFLETTSLPSDPKAIGLTVVLPGLIAVTTGIIVGVRIGRNLNNTFRRVHEVTRQRVQMTARSAQLAADLRDANLKDDEQSRQENRL